MVFVVSCQCVCISSFILFIVHFLCTRLLLRRLDSFPSTFFLHTPPSSCLLSFLLSVQSHSTQISCCTRWKALQFFCTHSRLTVSLQHQSIGPFKEIIQRAPATSEKMFSWWFIALPPPLSQHSGFTWPARCTPSWPESASVFINCWGVVLVVWAQMYYYVVIAQ